MPDGSFDPSFGSNGQVTTSQGAELKTTAVALQPDGRIVVAGSQRPQAPPAAYEHFFVMRYLSSGALDTTFGSAGFGRGPGDNLHGDRVGLALEDNGKQVVASNPNGPGYAVARFTGDAALNAASLPAHAVQQTLTATAVQPLLAEAVARWQAAGVGTAALAGLDIRVADLGGTTLGLASGHTIWLDDNAAGWGWFLDPTPADDSEFTTPGDQGEQQHMDLLTVLEHEVGHLLGLEHTADGVMTETLTAGTRRLPGSDLDLRDPAVPASASAARGPGFAALATDDSVLEALVSWVDPRRGRKKA
jgi:hypothetical protein